MDMMRDQYGNKVGRKDEFGEPIQERDTSYGTHQQQQQQQGKGAGTGHGTRTTTGPVTSGGAGTGGIGGQPQLLHPDKEEPHNGGVLRRSGSSSSSSSSEDDGMGGRRKKGLKEKIKEKLPGGRKTNEQQHGQTATGGYGTTTGQHEPVAEQKGIAEKIKEKIPGGGGNKTGQERAYGTTTGYGSTPGGTTATGPAENKGMMEKIKEKIPGGHKTEEHAHGTAGYGTTPGTAATTTGTTAPTGHNEPAENKGMMGKIKEKLPGRH